MPVDFRTFDQSLKKGGSSHLEKLCDDLKLNQTECRYLESKLGEICVIPKRSRKGKSEGIRQLSRWQQCIKERRSGKKFDPQAIRDLAKEYHAGRCPSGT